MNPVKTLAANSHKWTGMKIKSLTCMNAKALLRDNFIASGLIPFHPRLNALSGGRLFSSFKSAKIPANLRQAFFILFSTLILFPTPPAAAQETPTDKPAQAPAGKSADKPAPGNGKGDQGWNYKKFLTVFKKSGRTTQLTAKEFARLQDRKLAMLKDIHRYLVRKFGWADPRLMKAFEDLPREYFHYDYQDGVDLSKFAYEYPPRTWGLGWGSALSDYEGQAYMAQLAHPGSKDKVLEVGTGSGYNISLLSRVAKEAYSIEIISPLGRAVSHIFKPLGYTNVHTRVG